jgi:hypothetical protein
VAEREKCAICLRGRATDADWELNGEIGHDDNAAAEAGLDDLCWDQEDDSCLGTAIDLGRPTSYLEAMESLSKLQATPNRTREGAV